MRGISVLIGATTMAFLVASQSVGAHPSDTAKCPPAHAHVLRSDRQAVVYEGVGPGSETREKPGGGSERDKVQFLGIRGCARGFRRSYELGPPPSGEGSAGHESGGGTRNEALGGAMVAYEKSVHGCGLDESECSGKFIVLVRNLSTGRIVHKVPTGTPLQPTPGYVGVGETTAIVVKSDGAVAWITEDWLGESGYQVHALDSTGSRVLASNRDIEPHALGLRGSELYWVQGGKRMSAVLN
jgi:hypothetical protein